VAELDLGRGAVGVHVERERELEELLPLVGKDNDFYGVAQTLLETLREIPTVSASYMAQNSLYKEFI
jgi:hypothetical protein